VEERLQGTAAKKKLPLLRKAYFLRREAGAEGQSTHGKKMRQGGEESFERRELWRREGGGPKNIGLGRIWTEPGKKRGGVSGEKGKGPRRNNFNKRRVPVPNARVRTCKLGMKTTVESYNEGKARAPEKRENPLNQERRDEVVKRYRRKLWEDRDGNRPERQWFLGIGNRGIERKRNTRGTPLTEPSRLED